MSQSATAVKNEAVAKNETPKEPKTFTIVNNNREALVIGQMPHLGHDTSGVPQLGQSITFLPGINLIDTIVIETLRKNPSFELNFTTKIQPSKAPEQNQAKVGEFILVAQGEVPVKNPLAKLGPEETVALIEETFSLALLEDFLANEGRDSVRATIQSQMRMIRGGDAPHGAAHGH